MKREAKAVAQLQYDNLQVSWNHLINILNGFVQLLKTLDNLRAGRSEEPVRSRLILRDEYFEKTNPILPEMPRIRLSGRLRPIHSSHSSIFT